MRFGAQGAQAVRMVQALNLKLTLAPPHVHDRFTLVGLKLGSHNDIQRIVTLNACKL
jgi:hypothetical protein